MAVCMNKEPQAYNRSKLSCLFWRSFSCCRGRGALMDLLSHHLLPIQDVPWREKAHFASPERRAATENGYWVWAWNAGKRAWWKEYQAEVCDSVWGFQQVWRRGQAGCFCLLLAELSTFEVDVPGEGLQTCPVSPVPHEYNPCINQWSCPPALHIAVAYDHDADQKNLGLAPNLVTWLFSSRLRRRYVRTLENYQGRADVRIDPEPHPQLC